MESDSADSRLDVQVYLMFPATVLQCSSDARLSRCLGTPTDITTQLFNPRYCSLNYYYYLFMPRHFIARVLKLEKVKMYVRNGYDGDRITLITTLLLLLLYGLLTHVESFTDKCNNALIHCW